jgi:hypothetical protein
MLELTDQQILEELRQWVQQYAEDDPNPLHSPQRPAQQAALLSMNYFLGSWQQGLDKKDIRAAQAEIARMLEILHAFQGKLSIIDYMVNGLPPEEDDE